jgi:release factor glutamine methyltransferase
MNYQEILNEGTKILKSSNIKSFNLDSEILLASSLKLDRPRLLLNLNKEINKDEREIFFNFIDRRKKSEPIAYILGFKEFWKNNFKINKSVLIPRPDTEIVVEEVLKEIKSNESKQILDIGTGSGCIILSVLNERKKSYGYGIDISKKAINLAKNNAKIQHIYNRIKFLHSDIDNFYFGKYDLIVSNPPYIKLSDIGVLDRDIKFFEPNLALNGGLDGYSKIRKVINKSSVLIKKDGKLILEIGFNQVINTTKILKTNGFYVNRIVKDFSRINRCIVATKL